MHCNQTSGINVSLFPISILLLLFSITGCRTGVVPDKLAVTSIPSAAFSTRLIETPTIFATVTEVVEGDGTPTATVMIQPAVGEETAVFSPPSSNTHNTPFPPLPTPQGTSNWTLKVPILMYHYISEPPADADIYRIDLSVTPNNFREQMAYLAENGFQTIDLYDLSAAITSQIDLPPKPVIITIDDGYRDAYENAFPILQEFGLKATFFVAPEFVDQEHEAYMNWPMIEELASSGMRIESISKTHADLSGQDRNFLIWQILGAQETIAAHIGYTPRYFAYPYGRYDAETIQLLEELNFWGALTTVSGHTHSFSNRFEWTRVRIQHDTQLAGFIELVEPTIR